MKFVTKPNDSYIRFRGNLDDLRFSCENYKFK